MAQDSGIKALPTHLTLEVVTPDRSVVTEQVDEVEIPGVTPVDDLLFRQRHAISPWKILAAGRTNGAPFATAVSAGIRDLSSSARPPLWTCMTEADPYNPLLAAHCSGRRSWFDVRR